jgi:integrase
MNLGGTKMTRPPQFKDVDDENKELILEYINFRKNNLNKAKQTTNGDNTTLVTLARFIKKPLKDVTEQDLQEFFSKENILNRLTADLYAVRIVNFYKWLFKLKKRQRPAIMEWYEYQTKQQKNKSKDPNAKEKYFVLPEDYEKLIKYSLNFQEKTLWEIMYLSGARPSEILTMNISDS